MSDYMVSELDDGSMVVTGYDAITEKERKIILSAIEKYSTRAQQSTVFPTDDTSVDTLTFERINELAVGLQSNKANLMTVNTIVRQQILVNGLLGRTYESIISNVNTDYTVAYPAVTEDITKEDIDEVKPIIDQFNEDVDMHNLIREGIGLTYIEGNYPVILRIKDGTSIIEHYPLSLAYPSDYEVNRESVLEFNVDELKRRLRKTYSKNKKNKAIYYDNIEKEIADNYPSEVLKAYRDGEKVIRLDHNYTGCIKINSMGRKFGVTPFFKCLKPLIVLSNIEEADVASSKARKKKILFQKLRKELMGTNGDRKGLGEQALAHESAVNAVNTNFGLYTAPPFVESLEYVTDTSSSGDKDIIATYNSQMLTALGIGFADTNVANYSVANISVDQLMRVIDSIAGQFEKIVNKFYKIILEANGKDSRLAPKIKIAKSEQLAWDIKKEIATFLYTTLNGSAQTAMEYIGVDSAEELRRREYENDNGYDVTFYPRQTSYTATSDSGGRPKDSDDTGKQQSDEDYNKNARNG